MVGGGGRVSVEKENFYWANTTLGNLKCASKNTFNPIQAKHALRYLAECPYKYNRRYELRIMIERLLFVPVKNHCNARVDAANRLNGVT